jgi:hypothetical protein
LPMVALRRMLTTLVSAVFMLAYFLPILSQPTFHDSNAEAELLGANRDRLEKSR